MKRSDCYATPSNITEKTASWLADIRSQTRRRSKLSLAPTKCALLVVDMLHYFAHPNGRSFLPATAAITPRIAVLIDAWRSIGAPIIYTRHCHDGPHDLGLLGRFYSDYIRAGLPEADIISELAPGLSETVVRKTTYDGFHRTELEETLLSLGATQVLVTGVLTHLCCETTARSAFVRGFEVYVAADGTASSSERLHVSALTSIADGFGIVMSAEEIRAKIKIKGKA